MQLIDGKLIYSASDLVGHSACNHMSSLSIAHRLGLADIKPDKAEGMAMLAGKRGTEHEKNVLARLIAEGKEIVDLSGMPAHTFEELQRSAQATQDALESGAEVIYQGLFFDGQFLGYPDFLIRVNDSRYQRGFTYEVWDAKLKKSLTANAVIQLGAYARHLLALGFELAPQMHVYLGDMNIESTEVDEIMPFIDSITESFELYLKETHTAPSPLWAPKVSACDMCKWKSTCAAGRESVRDLSLIAGMRGDTAKKLRSAGINTVEELSLASDEDRPKSIGADTFARLRAQARLQSQQDADPAHKVIYEAFSPTGLALLPTPNDGDIWFDMEGDPFALAPNGLEYLFGAITYDTKTEVFKKFWAHNPAEEKSAFEDFVDWVEERRKKWEGLHIYHYASYERTRMGALAARYGTREEIIDNWFRSDLMIDLYKVVGRSIRISQRSYSIKKLEPLYDFERKEDIKTAGDSVVDYEDYLELIENGEAEKAQEKLDGIAAYNLADCISTRELDVWLRERATELEVPYAIPHYRQPSDSPELEAEAALIDDLSDGVPVDPKERTSNEQARALTAAGVGFHSREGRVQWWDHFHWIEAESSEWEGQDKVAAVTGAESTGWLDPIGKGRSMHREVSLEVEGGEGLRIGKTQAMTAIFDVFPDGDLNSLKLFRYTKQVDVTRTSSGRVSLAHNQIKSDPLWDALPVALIASTPINSAPLHKGNVDAGQRALATKPDLPKLPVFDLLARRLPNDGQVDLHPTGDNIQDLVQALLQIENSYVAVQGPPGTGKTYTTAHVIKALVQQHGWRIGVVGQSHKVVENVLSAAIDAGLSASLIAKELKGSQTVGPWQKPVNIEDWVEGTSGGILVAGTSWVFRRSGMLANGLLDLLVVEEAGQYSLANTISTSMIAKRLLLVGDQQQLPQVSQGSHPEPVDESALAWLLNGQDVIDSKYGYFLGLSYRMSPELCEAVSQLSYKGELRSAPEVAVRKLDAIEPGLHVITVDHSFNSTYSEEEAIEVLRLVKSMIGNTWTDKNGSRLLEGSDIKVVAPFNAQVSLISQMLESAGISDVAVGTVDRFQGQEAPVVIMSMTTSSPDEVARGWNFVMSRNRLNVAISRAQWATYLIYSPSLTKVDVKTPEQIKLLSGFLKLIRS